MRVSEAAEEILEALWIASEERGQAGLPCNLENDAVEGGGLQELMTLAYVEVGNDLIRLRPEGRHEAMMTVRRHRLAERLMMDILDMKGRPGDERACEFEHLLHHGVDTKICTLLNHPTTCPHGRPIPPGECCEVAKATGAIGVVALTELKAGEVGEIAYLSTSDPKKMQKLMNMGVLPGNRLELSRSYPTYIFRVGNSEFAVDEELAREIFIRKG
jgi:DtxR family transcriptional regulator, Mn-dependent transcriptional regulator